VHVATDGETYGHHHRYGDMALAYALQQLEASSDVQLINYAAHLAACPPKHEVRIVQSTSWSCAHGIERWRSDCGCNTGGRPGWQQAWRAPLREALDWLAGELGQIFEERSRGIFDDPWAARDAYIDVLLHREEDSIARFFARHGDRRMPAEARSLALQLLEVQRHALLMYTSCGWFFDEISGIETVQIIRYAARAIQLAEALGGVSLEAAFLRRLGAAPSNVPEHGDGATVYRKFVDPVDLAKVAAHYAVSSLFTTYDERARVYAYWVDQLDYRGDTLGRAKLAVGKVRVTAEITQETATFAFGILHFGDHNMSGGVREFVSDSDYEAMCAAVVGAFDRADVPEVLRLLDKHFLELTYSMRSLFKDEQRRVLDVIVRSAVSDAEALAGQLYESYSPLLRYLGTLDLPLGKPLRGLTDFVLDTTLRRELAKNELDFARLRALLAEAQDIGTELDRAGLGFALTQALDRTMSHWADEPEQLTRLRRMRRAAELARSLPFDIDFVSSQNRFYALMKSVYPRFADQAERGDAAAMEWREHFRALGEALRVRVSA
jgi:hypothetical protein